MLEQFQLVRLRMQPLGLWVRLHREWIWKFQRKRSHPAQPLGLHVQLVHKFHGPDGSLPFGADFFTGDSGCGCSG